ncbi:MAG: signal recognition particle-docking protein FtsY [Armatimonadota bacterium]|nr:signal recognition particle-docking protein FtsY [Armatimonadota bacterium]MDR7519033.1 signal recognition particle-docking protein FtsY [Armatimonadota bacterium]MDR7549188.1 signal recognition particle-docking protein FtsY [Armatimonadota bacterium]
MTPEPSGWLARLRTSLARTREALAGRLDGLLTAFPDGAFFEALEEVLIRADVGAALAAEIVDRLRQEPSARTPEGIRAALARILQQILGPPRALRLAPPPAVVLMLGVNGSGKTTTIGKLAHRLQAEGRRVLLAAADTFRAAAIEQLVLWGERVGAPVVRHQAGADPAAVVFDAAQAAVARRADVLIVDTAGRLHTKVNLMEELKKIDRVIARALPASPVERLLVLDATTGQNGLAQARHFHRAVGLTGAVLAKLDGTAKGGIVVAVARELEIPVVFVGTGEGPDDLVPFDPAEFTAALLAA